MIAYCAYLAYKLSTEIRDDQEYKAKYLKRSCESRLHKLEKNKNVSPFISNFGKEF